MSVNIDKEFEELRKDFLYHAEDLTLKLNSIISNQDLDKETFKEVFRIVHSLKGGAASHEFTNLSTICHHFEDFLTLKLVDELQNNEHYETCLKFTDILEEVIKKKIKGEEILFSKYIEQISYLNLPEAETSQGFKGQILVVDNTKTIGSIVKKSLEDTGYACTLTKDGLVAFNKLVTKKFDALISSINLSPFDGISLVTALRSTNNMNADIPILVISASKNIVERFPKDYRPNKVVVKDEQFIENLNHSLEDSIDHFKESAKKLYKCNYQMCTHAIGDSAARTILNIYGNILKDINDKRWRLEHAQVISENDFPLFRKYSIIPSVQPTHATSDMLWAILRLGNKRIKNSYAYGKLLYQNGSIALGTDFPIENINPIHTFYAATARKNLNGQPKNGFQIENALTRLEALKGMTIWAAIANFEENVKGSIEIGKAADMVVLDKDLISIEEDDILETKVLYTFVAGEQVYKN